MDICPGCDLWVEHCACDFDTDTPRNVYDRELDEWREATAS